MRQASPILTSPIPTTSVGCLAPTQFEPGAGVALGFVGLVAGVTTLRLATMAESSFRSWLLGAIPTGMLAAYLHIVHLAFLAHDAEAIRHVRGAWGEDNTRDELQRAKRKKAHLGVGRQPDTSAR